MLIIRCLIIRTILSGESWRQRLFLVACQAATAGIIVMSACTAPAAGSTIDSHEEPLEAAHRLIEKEETTMRELQEAVVILNREKDQFPDDVRIYVYLARAYYRIGGREENIDLEYLAYDQAGKYAKKALELDAGRAEAHYWHGLFLLKKAEKIGGLGALFIVREGIRELEVVRATMAEYDHGGASRVLGLLSCQAPSWTPFGDINRCVQLAEESVRIAPDHPLNRLYLADAYRQRGDREAAIREYREILSRASGWSESQRREFRQEALAGLTSLGEPVNGAKAASND